MYFTEVPRWIEIFPLMIPQVMRKKLLKCDINGLQEALVFKDKKKQTNKQKTPLLQGYWGGKEHFKLAGMGIAKGEAEISFLSGSVDKLFKSVYNHPNVLRHEDVSQR